jgi:hypothetical protein
MAKTKSPIQISLTDFIDFVCKTGSTKLTHVKNVKEREAYNPATDFYKALREGIIELHKSGGTKADLKQIIDSITDSKKEVNYQIAIDGYKKFWGRKSLKWMNPPNKHWVVNDLDVKINPEIGLEYDSKFYVIKLYLKSDKLSKNKIDQILALMEKELRSKVEDEVVFAVLDVKNAKLHANDTKDISLMALLMGEAVSFETIWKAL